MFNAKLKITKIVLLAAIAGVLFTFLQSCISGYAAPAAKYPGKFSGEDIFKALYFNEGAAAELLPTVNNFYEQAVIPVSSIQQARKDAAINNILVKIRFTNNNYFVAFEKAIKSDDYNEITTAIQQSQEVFAQAALNTMQPGNQSAKNVSLTNRPPLPQNTVNKININASLFINEKTNEIGYLENRGKGHCFAIANARVFADVLSVVRINTTIGLVLPVSTVIPTHLPVFDKSKTEAIAHDLALAF